MPGQGDKMNHQNILDERTQDLHCRDDYYTMRIISNVDIVTKRENTSIRTSGTFW